MFLLCTRRHIGLSRALLALGTSKTPLHPKHGVDGSRGQDKELQDVLGARPEEEISQILEDLELAIEARKEEVDLFGEDLERIEVA